MEGERNRPGIPLQLAREGGNSAPLKQHASTPSLSSGLPGEREMRSEGVRVVGERKGSIEKEEIRRGSRVIKRVRIYQRLAAGGAWVRPGTGSVWWYGMALTLARNHQA